MKKLIWGSILCLLMGTFACTPEENDQVSKLDLGNVDHFAFGTYYGHCLGNCAHAYKLNEDGLFPDQVERGYLEPGIAYATQSLSAENIALAQKLLEDFPAELMKEEAEVFGCPDCADQGGFYLEIKQGESTRSWRIDTNDDQIPAYLSAYTAKVRKAVEELEK